MLEIDNISFSYRDKSVISDVSFTVPQGSAVGLIGESGSGKSTLLKLIYGQYDLSAGSISYDGQPILGPKFNLIPGEDYIKYLAQDFGLMPYSTAGENVGKFLSNIYKDIKRERTSELLSMVGMLDYFDVKPQFLSGGQQQRVALAKALAVEPKILLLDEPFSQIDTFRANSLRRNLFAYLKAQSISCLIATHDSDDVLSFCDSVIVMKDGKVLANGTPMSVYENPSSQYVAALFDEVNEIPESCFGGASNERILVYPHQLIPSKTGLKATVEHNYFRGSNFLIEARSEIGNLFFENDTAIATGSLVYLTRK